MKWLERISNYQMTMPAPAPEQTTMTKLFDRKGFHNVDKVGSQGLHHEVRAVAW